MRLASVLAAVLLAAGHAAVPPTDKRWVNNVAKRQVFLNSGVVREEVTLTATPMAASGDARYLAVLPEGRRASFYRAFHVDAQDDSKRQLLEMTEILPETDEYVDVCQPYTPPPGPPY